MNNLFTSQTIDYFNLFLFIFLMLATACPVKGQDTSKKSLKKEDYHRWSTLTSLQISHDGKWVSYSKRYDYGEDTLFIQSTVNDSQFFFRGEGRLEFSDHGNIAFIQKDSVLGIQNLYSGVFERVSPILGYQLIHRDKYVIIRKPNKGDSRKDLVIRELSEGNEFVLEGVDDYNWSPTGTSLLYSALDQGIYTLLLLDLTEKKWRPKLLRESTFPFKQLIWGPSGRSFAFLQAEGAENKDLSLIFYNDLPGHHWFQMNPMKIDGMELSDTQLIISNDDQKIFFKANSKNEDSGERKQTDNEIVEIWHSQNKIIYPRKEALGISTEKALMWVWWPMTNRIMQLGTLELPYIVVTPNFDHVVSYNLWDNEPQFKRDADLNFYITDLATGKQQMLVEKLTYQVKYLTMSEDGQYIKYFKNGDWWVYNIEKQDHTNLTKGSNMELTYFDYGLKDSAVAFGSPGWSMDGNSALIYDRYDIWQISFDGLKRIRLTRGKEKGIKYRIYDRATWESKNKLFPSFRGNYYNLKNGLVLKSTGDDLRTGYNFWNPDKSMQTLVYKPKRVYGLKKAKRSKDYVYLEESFDEPTKLVHLKESHPPKTLATPNYFQMDYEWGISTLINYKNRRGDELQGVLIYPSDYDYRKKYPMIVQIYEKQLHRLNQSVIPSEYIIMNPTVFASNGYFVLYPNINYIVGNPGQSAMDCVVSAVDEVISKGLVDSQKIGLYGASFGGYETTFIISQTDIFTTAIAGAAITDLVSRYLSINDKTGLGEAWRYENHQFRMDNSFVVNFDKFLDNSPIHNAHGIRTPLLAWVGRDDPTVPWTQSVELYLALRRLGKEHVLLVYPNEKHIITDKEKKKDLSIRIQEWMDYYLKKGPKKDWMTKGYNLNLMKKEHQFMSAPNQDQ